MFFSYLLLKVCHTLVLPFRSSYFLSDLLACLLFLGLSYSHPSFQISASKCATCRTTTAGAMSLRSASSSAPCAAVVSAQHGETSANSAHPKTPVRIILSCGQNILICLYVIYLKSSSGVSGAKLRYESLFFFVVFLFRCTCTLPLWQC